MIADDNSDLFVGLITSNLAVVVDVCRETSCLDVEAVADDRVCSRFDGDDVVVLDTARALLAAGGAIAALIRGGGSRCLVGCASGANGRLLLDNSRLAPGGWRGGAAPDCSTVIVSTSMIFVGVDGVDIGGVVFEVDVDDEVCAIADGVFDLRCSTVVVNGRNLGNSVLSMSVRFENCVSKLFESNEIFGFLFCFAADK